MRKGQVYTSVPAPTLSSLSVATGPSGGGTVVTMTGINYLTATSVTFGGVPASFLVLSATTIQAIAPPQAAGTYDVTVSGPGGTSALSSADRFVKDEFLACFRKPGPHSRGRWPFDSCLAFWSHSVPAVALSGTDLLVLSDRFAPLEHLVNFGNPDIVGKERLTTRYGGP